MEQQRARDALDTDGEAFAAFWNAVPGGAQHSRKLDKQDARRAFLQTLTQVQKEEPNRRMARARLVSAMAKWAASPQGRTLPSPGQQDFRKRPARWLRAGTWQDDPTSWETGGNVGKPGADDPEKARARKAHEDAARDERRAGAERTRVEAVAHAEKVKAARAWFDARDDKEELRRAYMRRHGVDNMRWVLDGAVAMWAHERAEGSGA